MKNQNHTETAKYTSSYLLAHNALFYWEEFGIRLASATFLGRRRSHRTSSTEILLASMRRTAVVLRAWHRIGNRIRKAIQPVPNAYEDAAQTIGGRNTHGDKSDGFYPAARDALAPSPSRIVSSKAIYRFNGSGL